MKINLISLDGEILILNVAFPHLYNRLKVKKLLRTGYVLKSSTDADLIMKFKLY